VLVLFVAQLIIFGALLMAGHAVLRHLAIYSRVAYSLVGAAAAALAYVTAARYGILASSPGNGTWITAGILPTLAGTLSGFLYGQLAGIEVVGERPVGAEGAALRGRFDGPVQVRTSLAAIALTAFVPAVLAAVLAFSLAQYGFSGGGAGPKALAIALPAQIFMMVMFTTIVPSAIFMLVVHHIARALGLMRSRDYAALGAAGGLAFAVLAFPFSPFMSLGFFLVPAVLFGAVMGALYRRFAGLEPVPLPESIIVADEESLVGADDPARRGHSILLNG
jgi:hypothetical protein